MLGWTSDGDEEIRFFAAKVTAELAGSLRVVQIPGATQLVASLLDTIQQVGMAEQNSPVLKYLKQMAIYFFIPVDEPSNTHQRNSRLLRWWKQITKRWSVPEEEPSTDQDFLPIQGLLILQRLANFDPGNFILSNLAEIMDDNGSSHDLKQLAAEILKNLAMDRNTSEDIGHIRVIISSLMREFLSQDPSSSRNCNHLNYDP